MHFGLTIKTILVKDEEIRSHTKFLNDRWKDNIMTLPNTQKIHRVVMNSTDELLVGDFVKVTFRSDKSSKVYCAIITDIDGEAYEVDCLHKQDQDGAVFGHPNVKG
ncbi:hypothetical protein GDO78_020933 [Eleutherodactylus coqui]|uniref:Uncharacterized protein n=1 Tax=Eleutherodactylus coqui TaxID=57060 RepID=A0A8J6JZ34_ELECQ|nr:hypothetical protein GDO78_020933 [Eleutherodactylus coqui]